MADIFCLTVLPLLGCVLLSGTKQELGHTVRTDNGPVLKFNNGSFLVLHFLGLLFVCVAAHALVHQSLRPGHRALETLHVEWTRNMNVVFNDELLKGSPAQSRSTADTCFII